MHQLVVCTLQEGRVNRHHRLHAITGHTACKRDRVLLGNADIKIAIGILFFKRHQARTFAHGWRDAHQARIGSGLVTQPLAKNLRVSGLADFGGFHGAYGWIHFADGMKAHRIVFSQFIAIAFFGDNVQQLRAGLAAQVFQGFHQQRHIMTINRAGVFKAKFFKQRHMWVQRRTIHRFFDFAFDFFGHIHHAWHFVQHFFRFVFRRLHQAFEITHHRLRQVFGQRAHVRRNRHFIVVQNHQQIGIGHVACIVQGFKRLACRHRTITNDGHMAIGLALQLVGHLHAQSRTNRRRRMPHTKRIVFRFTTLRKTRQTMLLAHRAHAALAAC